MPITVYHNPENKTSCAVIKRIRAQGIEPTIIDILRDAPTRSDLIKIINRSGLSAWDILSEKEASARGIRKDMQDITKLLTMMAQNPRLLDHPIVVTKDSARVCRSAAQVDGLI